MTETFPFTGQQFIAGQRVASGEPSLVSLRAQDGEPTGQRFYPASVEEAKQAAIAAQQAFVCYSLPGNVPIF